MNIPFTVEQFMDIFSHYNTDIWPLQIVFYALALTAVVFTVKKRKFTSVFNSLVLAFLWIWMGIVYHLGYFTQINTAAYIFGILFIIQGAVFAYEGILKRRLNFQYRSDSQGIFGSIIIMYGLLLYPVFGYMAGHLYPQMPTFGLPCPTAIFTFGLLMWTESGISRYQLVIPLLWAVVGFNAAVSLTIYEDIGLLVSGIIAAVFLLPGKKEV
jgi:hypothetical protein